MSAADPNPQTAILTSRPIQPGPSQTAEAIRAALRSLADPTKAAIQRRFFKTGPGEYGEGDRFLGVPVPLQRQLTKSYRQLPLGELVALLRSPIHEERLTALLLLVHQFEKGDAARRRDCFELYLANLDWVNSWDLVDSSAPQVVGGWLLDHPKERRLLYELCGSPNLWRRRVAILSSYAFIRAGDSSDTLKLAERLLGDPHDLLHKAVGWMLREVGGRCDLETLRGFLGRHAAVMPRTMLRYAIEQLEPSERATWLAKR